MTRILVVDDDPLMRWSLEQALSREGYAVAAVELAEKALVDVTARHFDLVIVDVVLPRMSGLELIRKMRTVCPATRAIVITGQGSREVEHKAREHGACAYVEKPFSVTEVIGLVKTMLPSVEETPGHGEVQ